MRKKVSKLHTPEFDKKCESKKPKFDDDFATVQSKLCQFRSDESFVGEYCNVHLRPSFTVKAISYNSSIGRLCVIRQHVSNDEQQPCQLILVEFYNAVTPQLVFLERSIPVNDQFETLVWVANWAVFGASGGRLTALSPFTSKFCRVQLCVSDIVVMTLTSENNQFVVGNSSSELLIVNGRYIGNDGNEKTHNNKFPTFSTIQTIKLSSDEHITSIGCSKTMKPQMMAVGKVNGLSLFLYETQWKKHKEISIPHTKDNANIIWSLIFVGNFLFTGDARGQISIYNAENGTLLKTLKTHQAPILAIATNGSEVYAAGADYRVQVIKGISHNKVRFEWRQTGQRLFHANDVRAICVLDKHWLVSGGADHELFISDKFTYANPQTKSECAFFVVNSCYYVIVSLHLSHLDLWCKTLDGPYADQRKCLRRLLRITSGKLGFIKQFSVSSDGKFLAFAGAVAGAIRVFRLHLDQFPAFLSAESSNNTSTSNLISLLWSNDKCTDDDGLKQTKNTGGKAVSALFCSNKFLYFARGEFNLILLDLQTKQLRLLSSKEKGGLVTKICVNSADTCLVVLTIVETFYVDLSKLAHEHDVEDNELIPLELPSKMHPYDCIFYDNYKIMLLTADLSQHVILYDLRSNSKLFIIGNAKLNFVSNEWIAFMHVNPMGAVIATTNKGRLRLMTIEEDKLRLFADEPEREVVENTNMRIEPFWLEERHNSTANCSKFKFVLVKHLEEKISLKEPCYLRFFGKN